MNDWQHPNDMTRDEGIAQRERLRADLAAVRRTAELIAEAKRQDRERADALGDRRWQRQLDRRDKHELKTAEYQLGDMTLDPAAWAWGLTPARAADAYLAVLLAGGQWDDGEALDQLEVEMLERYGIDLHDLPTADRDRDALQALDRSGGQYDRVRAADHSASVGADAGDHAAKQSIDPDQVIRLADDAIGLFLEYRDQHGRDEDAARLAALQEVREGVDQLVLQRDDDALHEERASADGLTSRSEDAFQDRRDEARLEVSAAIEALCEQWQRLADDTVNHTPSAYMPDQYRRQALLRCIKDGRELVDGDTSALERIRQADRERIAQRIEDGADPAFADEDAALEWAARVARDDGSDGQAAEPAAGGPFHGPHTADHSAAVGAEAGDDVVAAAVTVAEAQVQLALDHLRSCKHEAPARPYATGHYLLTDDQWQTAIDELRRRGHVISEYTWVGAEDIDTVEGDHCYHLDEDTAAPTADERRGRFERKERVNRVHFDWANAHPGGDFWASAEAAAIEFDHDPAGGSDGAQATATPSRYVFTSGAPAEDCPGCGGDRVIGSPAQHEWNDRVQAALATWRANHDGDEESWWASEEAAGLIDQAPVDEDIECRDCRGSGLVGVQVAEDGSLVDAGGEPVGAVVPVEYRQDPTGVGAADTETEPTSNPDADTDTRGTPAPKVVDTEQASTPQANQPDEDAMPGSELDRDAEPYVYDGLEFDDDSGAHVATGKMGEVADWEFDSAGFGDARDGGRSPTPDEPHDGVDAAERAVFELKARRALEEQHAQARDRDRDDRVADRQADTTPSVEDRQRTEHGPVLSAFDD